MLKKTIEFEDYDGNQRTMDAYFNLSKSEITKWLVTDGDYTMDQKIQRLFAERNGKEIMDTFEHLIDSSYGIKSLDGMRFEKSPEILAKFKATPAYDSLFMELVTDSDKAATFFNAVVPKDLAKEMQKLMEENPEELPGEIRDFIPKTSDKSN